MKTPSSSRIVFAEDLSGASPWRPGPLGGAQTRGPAAAPESVEPAAPNYEDGLRDGFEKGLAHARDMTAEAVNAQKAEIAEHADQLLGAFTSQLASLQQTLADSVTELAIEIARSATGTAIRIDADLISPALHEALAAIVDEVARPVVRINPYDASLLSEQLAPLLAARGAHLVPDSAVSRGGCLVDTPRSSIDATIQTRWRQALAALGRDDQWIET